MKRNIIIILLVVTTLLAGAVWFSFYYNVEIEKVNEINTIEEDVKREQATRNLEILRDAVASRDVTLCEQISGAGYGFGPLDEVVFIDEKSFKTGCKQDAERGYIVNGELEEFMKATLR